MGSCERGVRERRKHFRGVWETGTPVSCPQDGFTGEMGNTRDKREWGEEFGWSALPPRPHRPALPASRGLSGDGVPSPASRLLWPPRQASVSPHPTF